MAKYLVIVESPKKTGYVKKFLGKGYVYRGPLVPRTQQD